MTHFEAGDIESSDTSERLSTGFVNMTPKKFGVSDIPEEHSHQAESYDLHKCSVLVNLLGILMKGPAKPNSPIFELNKIEREIKNTERNGGDTKHLERLRESISTCCPPESTVYDGLMYKEQRVAIMRMLDEQLNLSKYMDNGYFSD